MAVPIPVPVPLPVAPVPLVPNILAQQQQQRLHEQQQQERMEQRRQQRRHHMSHQQQHALRHRQHQQAHQQAHTASGASKIGTGTAEQKNQNALQVPLTQMMHDDYYKAKSQEEVHRAVMRAEAVVKNLIRNNEYNYKNDGILDPELYRESLATMKIIRDGEKYRNWDSKPIVKEKDKERVGLNLKGGRNVDRSGSRSSSGESSSSPIRSLSLSEEDIWADVDSDDTQDVDEWKNYLPDNIPHNIPDNIGNNDDINNHNEGSSQFTANHTTTVVWPKSSSTEESGSSSSPNLIQSYSLFKTNTENNVGVKKRVDLNFGNEILSNRVKSAILNINASKNVTAPIDSRGTAKDVVEIKESIGQRDKSYLNQQNCVEEEVYGKSSGLSIEDENGNHNGNGSIFDFSVLTDSG